MSLGAVIYRVNDSQIALGLLRIRLLVAHRLRRKADTQAVLEYEFGKDGLCVYECASRHEDITFPKYGVGCGAQEKTENPEPGPDVTVAASIFQVAGIAIEWATEQAYDATYLRI